MPRIPPRVLRARGAHGLLRLLLVDISNVIAIQAADLTLRRLEESCRACWCVRPCGDRGISRAACSTEPEHNASTLGGCIVR
jgi:hypothetical protein